MANRKQNREKGTGTIEKKRNHFYLKLRTGGKTKSTLLRDAAGKAVTTRKDAEAAAKLLNPILRATQKEEIACYVAEARKLKQEAALPIERIWETYLKQYNRPDSSEGTLQSYQKSLRYFTEWLEREKPEIRQAGNITEEIAADFFTYIWNERQVSGKTFNIYRQALQLIFKHVMKVAGLEENPFSGIERKPVQMESRLPFSEDQVRAIFSGFDTGFYYTTTVGRLGPERKHIMVKEKREYNPMNADEMRVLLTLCCWTGCRGQDGCLMSWSNVDLEHQTISFVPRKTARKTNNRSVSLPLHPELYQALMKALKFRERNKPGEDYIIPLVAARYQYNPGGIQADVKKIIACATGCDITAKERGAHRAHRANLYSLHSLRHTFVSFCVNRGVSLDVIAEIIGHGSPEMTRHYAHISDQSKRTALAALPTLKTSEQESSAHREQLMDRLAALPTEQLEKLLVGSDES